LRFLAAWCPGIPLVGRPSGPGPGRGPGPTCSWPDRGDLARFGNSAGGRLEARSPALARGLWRAARQKSRWRPPTTGERGPRWSRNEPHAVAAVMAAQSNTANAGALDLRRPGAFHRARREEGDTGLWNEDSWEANAAHATRPRLARGGGRRPLPSTPWGARPGSPGRRGGGKLMTGCCEPGERGRCQIPGKAGRALPPALYPGVQWGWG